MASRLKTATPKLKAAKSRLRGPASGSDERRASSPHWRKWYATKRWRRLRLQVFVRDGYQCKQTGVLLNGTHPAPSSPVADHIKEHRGDPKLFWDPDNLQSVSKQWHDRVKQKLEHAGRNVREI